METKLRILYLAWTPPGKSSGATLAMRRHLIEHDDFEVFVATSGQFDEPNIPSYKFRNPVWLDRIGRTRFWRFVRNFEMLCWSGFVPKDLIDAARDFRPNAVFTVSDLTISKVASRLARILGVPLISNFQDWWPRGQFYFSGEKPFSFLIPVFENRFRKIFKQSALVFCTSQGMKDYLGPHPNSHVLYPICAKEALPDIPNNVERHAKRKRTLLYTGTAFGSYGRMLRDLAKQLEKSDGWELVIYGARPDWPEEEILKAEKSGLYRGFVPFEKLKKELYGADACLSVMSFDPDLEVMMRTSFTTKLLDYCSAARPIIMWGPSFSSPVQLTKEREAALTVEEEEPKLVVKHLEELDSDASLEYRLAENALKLAKEDLSHDRIHALFVRQISKLIE